MTSPKEKAIELVDKIYDLLWTIDYEDALTAAEITVNEILDDIEDIHSSKYKYWKEVKKSIR